MILHLIQLAPEGTVQIIEVKAYQHNSNTPPYHAYTHSIFGGGSIVYIQCRHLVVGAGKEFGKQSQQGGNETAHNK